MGRKEEFYILLGLLIAALSCGAGWLALPWFSALLTDQLQPWLTAQLQNPLFLPLVIVICILLIVLRDTIIRVLMQLRALLPGNRLETRYLQAVVRYLRHTPALLVISERQETHTELDLLQAYSQLTLDADPDHPEPAPAPSLPAQSERAFFMGGRNKSHLTAVQTRKRTPLDTPSWILAQSILVGAALLFLRNVLFSSNGIFNMSWGSGFFALVIILVWFGLAVLFQRFILPRLASWHTERRNCSANPMTPGAEIWDHPRLLIRGDPGSGKTTLLRHIAIICAQEHLKQSSRLQLRDAYGWPNCLFPIYVPLRALRDAAITANRPLLESYTETVHELGLLGDIGNELSSDFFQKRAEQGGCIILLDAFDELRDADARRRLGRLVADLPPGPKNTPNRIVVTSRIVGYEGQLRGHGFSYRLLARLSVQQTEDFIRQRYHALAALGVRAAGETSGGRWNPEQRAQRLIKRLPENSGLRRLDHNPFLLSLIISVHLKSPHELPRQRHALYEKAMAMLVEEWERLKDSELDLEPTSSAADLEADLKLRLLYELAWAMYERTLGSSDDRSYTVITSSAAEQILAAALRHIPVIAAGRTGDELDLFCRSEARRWLRNLGQRGGVLQAIGNVQGSNEEQIQFAHQTFQEYLASQAIDTSIAEQQRMRVNRLYERWNDQRWREVILLYGSTCADATPIIQLLLNHKNEYADLLAGAVLAEQPRRLEHSVLEGTLQRLKNLIMAPDTQQSVALEALNTFAETGLDTVKQGLEQVARSGPQLVIRVRAIELLANMEANRPAPTDLAAPIQQLMLDLLQTEQEPQLRLAAGFALAHGDPRYTGNGWLPEMIKIPAGPFLMGSSDADPMAEVNEKPQHRLELPDYWIARAPVTNAQWQYFLDAGGYRTRRYWSRAGWRWLRCGWEPQGEYSTPQIIAMLLLGPLFDPLVGLLLRRKPFSQPHPESWDDPDWNGDNQPVTGISYYEAEAYCRWLSEVSKHSFCLPTEVEWEKTARGPDGRIWPWGNAWKEAYCNSHEAGLRKPSPVGSYPNGIGFYGTLDMAGNSWEWCTTRWKSNYPWRKPDLSERVINLLVWLINARVIRGGAYNMSVRSVRGAYRYYSHPRHRFYDRGLRVASHSPYPS